MGDLTYTRQWKHIHHSTSEDNDLFDGFSPWVLLANAIITRAAFDLRSALAYNNEDLKNECMQFLRSEYMQSMTDVDGEYIIQRIIEEHREDERKRKEKMENDAKSKEVRADSPVGRRVSEVSRPDSADLELVVA